MKAAVRGAAGVLRLALAAVPVPGDRYLLPAPLRAWLMFLQTPQGHCGRRSGCSPSARACSRSAPGPGLLPASGPGADSALLRLVAAGALIAAAGLVLPYVAAGPDRRPDRR